MKATEFYGCGMYIGLKHDYGHCFYVYFTLYHHLWTKLHKFASPEIDQNPIHLINPKTKMPLERLLLYHQSIRDTIIFSSTRSQGILGCIKI